MKTVFALLPGSHAASQRIQCWTLVDDAAVVPSSWQPDELADHKGTQCVLIVPGSSLSWLRISVPPQVKLQGHARSMQLLQSLVEELLLEEAEAVHLALPPQLEPGSQAMIAACSKPWLAQWLQRLEQAGIRVVRVIPESAPDILGQMLCSSGQGADIWVSGLSDSTPVTVPVESGPAVFASEGEQMVQALPSAYESTRQIFGAQRVQLLPEQDWLQALSKTAWNLAQHGFAGSLAERWRRRATLWQHAFFHGSQWRAARAACVVLGVGVAVTLNVQAWRMKWSMQAQEQALHQTVQQAFPAIRLIVDAPLQMQRELQRLRREAGVADAADFEPMASAAGAALHALGLQASGVRYSRGQLVLTGIPAAQLDALRRQLAGSGYVAVPDGQAIRLQEDR